MTRRRSCCENRGLSLIILGVGVILHLGAKVREIGVGGLSIEDPEKLLKWLAPDRASLRGLFGTVALVSSQVCGCGAGRRLTHGRAMAGLASCMVVQYTCTTGTGGQTRRARRGKHQTPGLERRLEAEFLISKKNLV